MLNFPGNGFYVVWNFRNKTNVSAPRNCRVKTQPAGFVAHYFNNHYAAVTVRRSVNSVDTFRCNIDCRMEAESNIRSNDIVVDGFRKSDNIQAFLIQKASRGISAVSAKHNKSVQTPFFPVFLDGFNR